MKMLIGILGTILALVCIVPVCAAEEGGQAFVFGKNKAKLHYVVYTAPIFNGTGYASQSHLNYAPYRGGFSYGSGSQNADYYHVVRQIP